MVDFKSRMPHCPEVSLKEKAREENVDYNNFLDHLSAQKSDEEMADELGISLRTVEHLREQFEKVGVHSIIGQE
ncbi:helix-turn-helix domain-containing protein [Metallumcola ferriviriculae]|uniref:Helix-turn-helix domain-containing protein n=1 Tax=Metallumcola ferriviriculae TaxID=3039180 RepID=A0AAU0UPX4_9FIRM|nr:helix-turn-helix domain-containing protein [Desulfitibacteraceae bacterium MK1]